MQPLTKSAWDNWRWWFGLVLTLLVIGLLVWNITLTRELLLQREFDTSRVTGYPTKRLDDIWLRVSAIENYLRSTPLVECGDQHGPNRPK